MITKDSIFKKNPNIVVQKIVDEFVFVPVEEDVLNTRCIYSTNEIGGRIWELIDGKNAISDIVRNITDEYTTDEDTAFNDIQEFIATAQEKGCVDQIK